MWQVEQQPGSILVTHDICTRHVSLVFFYGFLISRRWRKCGRSLCGSERTYTWAVLLPRKGCRVAVVTWEFFSKGQNTRSFLPHPARTVQGTRNAEVAIRLSCRSASCPVPVNVMSIAIIYTRYLLRNVTCESTVDSFLLIPFYKFHAITLSMRSTGLNVMFLSSSILIF